MVLDANGKLLRQMTPFVRPPAFHFDPELQGKDFKRQIDQLLEGLTIPTPTIKVQPKLALPDVPDAEPLSGVRIYLTFGNNRLNHYRTPTVEAVQTSAELRQSLRYPDQKRAVKAETLRPWLEQIYPPAIMDGQGGFDRIDAAVTIRPAETRNGTRYALIEGDVEFVLDNTSRITYYGQLTGVVEYNTTSADPQRICGVCECVFPKTNPQGQVVERIRMTAAIESRPG